MQNGPRMVGGCLDMTLSGTAGAACCGYDRAASIVFMDGTASATIGCSARPSAITATCAPDVRADVAVSMRLSVPPLTTSVAAAMARDEEFPAWLAGLPHERMAMQEKMRKVHWGVASHWQNKV